MFIVFVIVGLAVYRIFAAGDVVTQAAADAARTASIARTPAQARREATASALATLRQKGLSCTPRVSVDVSRFARPPGRVATVSATVTCTVPLRDVAMEGLPWAWTQTRTHTSVLDLYRSR